MRATRLWVLSTLPFLLAACGSDEEAVIIDDNVVATPADTGFGGTAAPAPGMFEDATMQPATVAMNAVGGSGVSGQMEVMAHGEQQTMVSVTLNGPAGASSTHSGHIHQGTCDSPGAVVVPLQDITLANGTGMAASTVDVAPSAAMNGQHIVAYHERAGDNPGAPVVCGAIPAQGGTTGM